MTSSNNLTLSQALKIERDNKQHRQRAYDAMLEALKHMLEAYWGEGDGVVPPPHCVQLAQEAIKLAEKP